LIVMRFSVSDISLSFRLTETIIVYTKAPKWSPDGTSSPATVSFCPLPSPHRLKLERVKYSEARALLSS
jgi:hypothetical protein